MLFDSLDFNTNRINANTTKPVRKPHTHAVALAAAVFRSSQCVSAASVPASVGILLSALLLGKKKVAAVELAVRREVYCGTSPGRWRRRRRGGRWFYKNE